MQLDGGYGHLYDYCIERLCRTAKLLEIYGETKEIDKIVIGRRPLNLV